MIIKLIKYSLVTFVVLFLQQNQLYANHSTCDYEDSKFNKELKKYKIRIDDFIQNNQNLNCNILYAYNKILDNSEYMDEFENNPLLFQKFGDFIKNYPKTSQYINNKEEFGLFNKFKSIQSLERVLSKMNLVNNKDNKLYVLMALSFQKEYIDEQNLYNDIKELRKKYKSNDLKYLVPFWQIYVHFYKGNINFHHFIDIVNEISISTLKKYSNWQNFFPYFLSDKESNTEYIKVIKLLLDKSKLKDKYIFNFIQEVSFDIEDAINRGLNAKEIVSYLNYFISDRTLIEEFNTEYCSMHTDYEHYYGGEIIAQSLYDKVNFKKENEVEFLNIMNLLTNKKKEDKIVIISYFNLMIKIYSKLETKEAKNILIDLYNNMTNDKIANMRVITILYQYTSYFDDIINDNWVNDKYRDILYIKQDGFSSLDYLKSTDIENINKLNTMVHSLIRTKEENLNDLTMQEIRNLAIDTVDKASYATLIIPGAGIAVHAAKTPAKQSVKMALENISKNNIKKLGKDTSRFTKETTKDFWQDRVKYGDRRTKVVKNINKSIKELNKLSLSLDISGIVNTNYRLYFNQNQKSICGEEI
ncbi:hypothetical protein ACOL3I_00730 [Aliarcobacter butzleri]